MFDFEDAKIRNMFDKYGMEDRCCYFDTDEVAQVLERVLGDDWEVNVDEECKTWVWLRCRSQNEYHDLESLPEGTKELVDKVIELMEECGAHKVYGKLDELEGLWDDLLCDLGMCELYGCDAECQKLCFPVIPEKERVSLKAWLYV
jgi:hypothetical protein